MLDDIDHYPYDMVTYNITIRMQIFEETDDKYGENDLKKSRYMSLSVPKNGYIKEAATFRHFF
ncbi:hypothetical protein A7311_20360 [Paenibacillus polymyxa]|uniref:hypothetical protein n=1 Tax=Paenibacillus sp. FSL L8-0638 TaxID=2921604 RepID=UPI00083DBC2A|nr:hypothetical protein A7311_20360 [Paenibacillus polymyxa]